MTYTNGFQYYLYNYHIHVLSPETPWHTPHLKLRHHIYMKTIFSPFILIKVIILFYPSFFYSPKRAATAFILCWVDKVYGRIGCISRKAFYHFAFIIPLSLFIFIVICWCSTPILEGCWNRSIATVYVSRKQFKVIKGFTLIHISRFNDRVKVVCYTCGNIHVLQVLNTSMCLKNLVKKVKVKIKKIFQNRHCFPFHVLPPNTFTIKYILVHF